MILFQRKIVTLANAAKIAGISATAFEETLKKRAIKIPKKKETAVERTLRVLAPDDPLRQAIKPLRKNVTADDLMREQGYTGTNWEKVRELAERLAIEEPLELLLAQLKD